MYINICVYVYIDTHTYISICRHTHMVLTPKICAMGVNSANWSRF